MDFVNWVLSELKKREMSQSDLAHLCGVTSAQISRIISGERKAGEKTLLGIAKAFKISPEIVFEKADILPPSSEKRLLPMTRELLQLANRLPDSDVEMVIALLKQREDYYKKNPQARPTK